MYSLETSRLAKLARECRQTAKLREICDGDQKMSDGVAPRATFLPAPGTPVAPWGEWIKNFERENREARGGVINHQLIDDCLATEGQAQSRATQEEPAEGVDGYIKPC